MSPKTVATLVALVWYFSIVWFHQLRTRLILPNSHLSISTWYGLEDNSSCKQGLESLQFNSLCGINLIFGQHTKGGEAEDCVILVIVIVIYISLMVLYAWCICYHRYIRLRPLGGLMYEANQAPDMISHIMHSRWAKGVKKQHLQKEKQKQHMFDTCFLVCMHPDSFELCL